MFDLKSVKILGFIGVGLSAAAMLISNYTAEKMMDEKIDQKIEERFSDNDEEEE